MMRSAGAETAESWSRLKSRLALAKPLSTISRAMNWLGRATISDELSGVKVRTGPDAMDDAEAAGWAADFMVQRVTSRCCKSSGRAEAGGGLQRF